MVTVGWAERGVTGHGSGKGEPERTGSASRGDAKDRGEGSDVAELRARSVLRSASLRAQVDSLTRLATEQTVQVGSLLVGAARFSGMARAAFGLENLIRGVVT